MKVTRPSPAAAFVLSLLLILNPLFTGVSSAAQPAAGSTPPWNDTDGKGTQEKVKPKEIQDKEKKGDSPTGWCTKTKKNGDQETTATYVDGTEVKYIPGKSWTIIIPGANGKTKITYDMVNKTRTVQEPGKQPVVQDPAKDNAAKDWKEGKEAEEAAKKGAPCGGTCNPTPAPNSNPPAPNPAQPKKGSWLFPSDSTRLANVAFPTYTRAIPASRETPVDSHEPAILLAATSEQPRPPESQGQGKVVVINLKIVTYGDPPSETVAFFDPGPQTTPEKFLDTPVTTANWDPKRDGGGPQTARPGPTGIPVTEIPGGGIYIGWGWTSGYVGQSMVEECGGGDDDADLKEAQRLTELAKKAREGGPEYWRKRAQTEDANAKRAEQDQRGPAKDAALKRAKEDRETADELQRRGVPDKPDPKLPKNQRDDIDKQRADAIKKITDEAGELTRKASTK